MFNNNEYTIADMTRFDDQMQSASDRMPSCAGGSCRFIGQSDERKPGTFVQMSDIIESAPEQFPPIGPNIHQMNGTAVGYMDKVVDVNENPHTALMLQHNFDPTIIDVNLKSETLVENGGRCSFNKTCGGVDPQSKDGYTFYKDYPLFVGHIPGGFIPVDDHVHFMGQGNTPTFQAMDRQLAQQQQTSDKWWIFGSLGAIFIPILIIGGFILYNKTKKKKN